MSAKEIKALYQSLLESGDLNMIMPNATGDWSVDKKVFEKEYTNNSKFLDEDYNDELFLSEDGF